MTHQLHSCKEVHLIRAIAALPAPFTSNCLLLGLLIVQECKRVELKAHWFLCHDADMYAPSNFDCSYVNFECNMSIQSQYEILIILWVGFFVVAIYFDNIFPNEIGLKR